MPKLTIDPENFEEMMLGELHDFVLSLIQKEKDNIPQDFLCRRKELCEALLQNKKLGAREKLREKLAEKLRSSAAPKLTGLSSLGFQLEHNKHFKLSWRNKPYKLVLPMSPSDHRYLQNLLADLDHKFF